MSDAASTVVYPKPPKSIEDLAEFWRVNERTVKRWRAAGAPLHDVAEMMEWSVRLKRAPQGFLTVCDEMKKDFGPRPNYLPPDAVAPAKFDWSEGMKAADGSADPNEAMAAIKQIKAWALIQFKDSADVGDKADQKHFMEIIVKAESVQHDAELRAQKLGMDSGQLFTKDAVEQLVKAGRWWDIRGIENCLDYFAGKFAALAPQLDQKTVRGIMSPKLLAELFLKPLARACAIDSGVSLPDWMVEAQRKAVGDQIEEGETLFDEARKGS